MQKQRIAYIDISKFIAVLFVLVSHTQYYIPVSNNFMKLRVIWIAFFLPIFFLTVGLTSSHILDAKFSTYVNKKVKGILVPYIIWCFILNFGGFQGLTFFKAMIIGNVQSLDSVYINSIIWFLPAFFTASLIFYLTCLSEKTISEKIKCNFTYIKIALIAILIVFDRAINRFLGPDCVFGISSAFQGAALMMIGNLCSRMLSRIYEMINARKAAIAATALILGIVLAYVNMPLTTYDGKVGYTHAIWMAKGYIGLNVFTYLGTAILSSIGILVISMLLEKVRFLSYLGKHSLLFMTMHIYTHSILTTHLSGVISTIPSEFIRIMVFVLLSATLITCTFPFIDRYMPFLYKPINNSR